MPEFPKPKFEFHYEVDAEIGRLRRWQKRQDRFIPAKSTDTLLPCDVEFCEFRGTGLP